MTLFLVNILVEKYDSFWYLFSIYTTINSYKEWKESPTITTVNTTAYPIESIDFPAITICSQGATEDIVDEVLLRQFEEYLQSNKIKSKLATSTQNGNSSQKRGKRSIEPRIVFTLSKEEVIMWLHELYLINGNKF